MNKVILIGNLTNKPELTETSSGVQHCRFSIAVNRPYKDTDGNTVTDFFNIQVWRGQAETCAKWLDKGRKVAIVGTIENRSYEDKDGVKRTVTEINANEVEFLSSKNSQDGEITNETNDKKEKPTLTETDEDLPF